MSLNYTTAPFLRYSMSKQIPKYLQDIVLQCNSDFGIKANLKKLESHLKQLRKHFPNATNIDCFGRDYQTRLLGRGFNSYHNVKKLLNKYGFNTINNLAITLLNFPKVILDNKLEIVNIPSYLKNTIYNNKTLTNEQLHSLYGISKNTINHYNKLKKPLTIASKNARNRRRDVSKSKLSRYELAKKYKCSIRTIDYDIAIIKADLKATLLKKVENDYIDLRNSLKINLDTEKTKFNTRLKSYYKPFNKLNSNLNKWLEKECKLIYSS